MSDSGNRLRAGGRGGGGGWATAGAFSLHRAHPAIDFVRLQKLFGDDAWKREEWGGVKRNAAHLVIYSDHHIVGDLCPLHAVNPHLEHAELPIRGDQCLVGDTCNDLLVDG